MKKLSAIACSLFLALSMSATAYAHCGSCGVGDKPKPQHACKKKCENAKDKKACMKKCTAHNQQEHKKKGEKK